MNLEKKSLVFLFTVSSSLLFANNVPYVVNGEVNEIRQITAFRSVDGYNTIVDENQDYKHKNRHLDGVTLKGSVDGNQVFWIDAPRKVYTKALHHVFTAKPGETLSPVFNYSGVWMNGYVYIDANQNGKFDTEQEQNGDIVVYSNVEGVNSEGVKLDNQNVLNPPSFTLPSDMKPGRYRMRYKVDWSYLDPAGRPEDGNGILKNGGAICDVLLNVHGDVCQVAASGANGKILQDDGTELNGLQTSFGKPLKIKAVANEGYVLDGVRVRHGYNLSGDSLVNGNPQYFDVEIPAYLFENGVYSLPANLMDGDVRIEGLFVADGAGSDEKEDYVLNFEKDALHTNTDRILSSLTCQATMGGKTQINLGDDLKTVYGNLLNKEVGVVAGDVVRTSVKFNGKGLHYYLYVDYNQDGHFKPTLTANGLPTLSGELVSYTYYNGLNSLGEKVADPASVSMEALPSFKIPELLPNGNYRARLKVDYDNIDPAGQMGDGNDNSIVKNGGYVVDFLLNVHGKNHNLEIISTNGSINGPQNTGLPMTVTPFNSLSVVPTAVASGYTAENMVIKHGHRLDGPQFVHGNRQWSEYAVPAVAYSLPKDSVNGDVQIAVHFEPGENATYKLVFADEFNGENGIQPDSAAWIRSPRRKSTWNRWLSDSKEVVYLRDGNLVTRAIPNPDQENDPVPMITGGIQSQNKFGFTYGKLECRAKANSWVGTFPAIWLMPEDQSAGWPSCGEIDIFECIDNEQTSYHTVHSHWTYDLNHKNDPKSGHTASVDLTRYHTYGLEWDAKTLRWFVDGKLVGSYAKSTNSEALRQRQWPFDKNFYIILNQSVGNGSWAKNPDLNHTYEFLVDWVRVYQKDGMNNSDGVVGLENVRMEDALNIEVVDRGVELRADYPTMVQIYDMQGRCLYRQQVEGVVKVDLSTGIYLVNGKKILVR